MRVFVAVAPSTGAVEDLEDFLGARQDAGSDLRWSPSWQWHVTLAFMGRTPERVIDDLLDRVGEVAGRTEPFELGIARGGCFPDVTRARVLWAGIRDDEALAPLARGVRSACAVAGAAPEGGPFRAHVTLGRFTRPGDATRWVRVLETYAGPPWTASWVTVFESHLPRERGHRPRHEVIARLPLRGRG
ncbi:RNA 2',3'-cyclic phosphodiesterase [Fodinibacter luteus]|uniref:RNA 2',3'-cyclic phosphodiesterase n=1 Tax=Fodinibacter luteus TaxID=552064 RepID=A0ABP8KKN1_9MICO